MSDTVIDQRPPVTPAEKRRSLYQRWPSLPEDYADLVAAADTDIVRPGIVLFHAPRIARDYFAGKIEHAHNEEVVVIGRDPEGPVVYGLHFAFAPYVYCALTADRSWIQARGQWRDLSHLLQYVGPDRDLAQQADTTDYDNVFFHLHIYLIFAGFILLLAIIGFISWFIEHDVGSGHIPGF